MHYDLPFVWYFSHCRSTSTGTLIHMNTNNVRVVVSENNENHDVLSTTEASDTPVSTYLQYRHIKHFPLIPSLIKTGIRRYNRWNAI